MKVYRKSHKPITAAESIGTTWYRVTSSQFRDFIDDKEENVFVAYTALNNGFEALNIAQMYGSAIVDDELFICETDGQPIVVGADADVSPETAFKDYTPEELAAYIEDADERTLIKYITYREFKPELLEDEKDNAAIEALQLDVPLEDVIKDYNELW